MFKKINFILISVLFCFFLTYKPINAFEDFKEINLGALYLGNKTDFKLYSNKASSVKLKIDHNENQHTYTMEEDLSFPGFWKYTVNNQDLNGAEYVYDITVDSNVYSNIVDPYAKAINATGDKGVVVNLMVTNPEEWNKVKDLKILGNNLFIYGLHVEDFSSDSSWSGSLENSGKFLALIEKELKLENDTNLLIGYSYLTSLGISHLELMPIYDANASSYTSGYKARFPFAISRRYTTGEQFDDPIFEFKQVITTYNLNSKSIVMKVDFTNFDDAFKSDMVVLVSDFFTNEGKINFSSFFVKKYLFDLFNYYSNEFKVGGFSIENISDFPLTFFEEIEKSLTKTNKNILLYGKGNYNQNDNNYVSVASLSEIENLSLMNPSLSLGLFGSLFNNSEKGVLTGDVSLENIESIKFAFLSGVDNGNLDYNLVKGIGIEKNNWISNNTYQMINFLSGYEGFSLNDKLTLYSSLGIKNKERYKQAYLSLFLSGGIPYVYNGDEFLKTRLGVSEFCVNASECFLTDVTTTGDSINWFYRETNKELVSYLKNIVNLRRNGMYSFNLPLEVLKNNLKLEIDENVFKIIYHTGKTSVGEIDKVFTIINFNSSENKKVVFDKNSKWEAIFITENNDVLEDGILAGPIGFYIAYSIKKAPFSTLFTLFIVIVIISLIYFLNTYLTKKIIEKKGNLDIKGTKKYISIIKRREKKKSKKKQNKVIDVKIKDEKEKEL